MPIIEAFVGALQDAVKYADSNKGARMYSLSQQLIVLSKAVIQRGGDTLPSNKEQMDVALAVLKQSQIYAKEHFQDKPNAQVRELAWKLYTKLEWFLKFAESYYKSAYFEKYLKITQTDREDATKMAALDLLLNQLYADFFYEIAYATSDMLNRLWQEQWVTYLKAVESSGKPIKMVDSLMIKLYQSLDEMDATVYMAALMMGDPRFPKLPIKDKAFCIGKITRRGIERPLIEHTMNVINAIYVQTTSISQAPNSEAIKQAVKDTVKAWKDAAQVTQNYLKQAKRGGEIAIGDVRYSGAEAAEIHRLNLLNYQSLLKRIDDHIRALSKVIYYASPRVLRVTDKQGLINDLACLRSVRREEGPTVIYDFGDDTVASMRFNFSQSVEEQPGLVFHGRDKIVEITGGGEQSSDDSEQLEITEAERKLHALKLLQREEALAADEAEEADRKKGRDKSQVPLLGTGSPLLDSTQRDIFSASLDSIKTKLKEEFNFTLPWIKPFLSAKSQKLITEGPVCQTGRGAPFFYYSEEELVALRDGVRNIVRIKLADYQERILDAAEQHYKAVLRKELNVDDTSKQSIKSSIDVAAKDIRDYIKETASFFKLSSELLALGK